MKYQINIPDPCSEDWNKMSPSEQGRFCASCQEEVIDFTKKSDAELLEFILSGSKSCGRYRKTQLEITYSVPEQPKIWQRYLRYGMAIGLGLLSTLGYSQAPKEPIVIQQDLHQKDKQSVDNQLDTVPSILISGVVVDSSGNPLAFASITYSVDGSIQGGETTDLDGRFSMNVELDSNGTASLECSSLGYETVQVVLSESAAELKIILNNGLIDIQGCITGRRVSPILSPKGEENKTIFYNRRGRFSRGK